jgi:hypothetical protein
MRNMRLLIIYEKRRRYNLPYILISFTEPPTILAVVVSTVVLSALAKYISRSERQKLNFKMVGQRLEASVCPIRNYGISLHGIELIQYSSIDDLQSDPELKNLDFELRNSIIQDSYRFGTLDGFRRYCVCCYCRNIYLTKVWMVCYSFPLPNSDSCYHGLLKQERVTDFILLPEITKQLTFEEIQQIETVFVPIIVNTVFAKLLANIITVTFLTLPRILTIFSIRPDIVTSRIGRTL